MGTDTKVDPVLRQVGALPFRRRRKSKAIEILLVSSRRTGRWIIPKGHVDPARDDRSMARLEAFEEAGVTGKMPKRPIGTFDYLKYYDDGRIVDSRVTVFPLAVADIHDDWPEKSQRARIWVDLHSASEMVEEAELAGLILSFAATRKKK